MRSKKKRKPKLTRIEKMTKGLMLSVDEIKSKFTVREVEEKGRALFLLSRMIRKDSFVLEYEGDVITHDEAEFREKIYEMNDEGCFILFFRFQGRRLAIDATRKFNSYARYLNHSREPNIRFHPPLLLDLTGQGVPRIAAYALRDIHEGEEIVFDYGISDGEISWLRNRKRCHASELTDSSEEESSSSSDDDDQRSSKDVVMSFSRSPMKSKQDRAPLDFRPNQNLCLRPSKYLPSERTKYLSSEITTPSTSISKPQAISVPRDGYSIRYIAYPSRPGARKCYIGSYEGLGQPLKIMRFIEERTSKDKESKSSQSVISLSESDESSLKSPPPSTPTDNTSCHSDTRLPFCSAPSSASKVLQWQERLNSSTAKQQDSISDIKILHVTSLTEGTEMPASSSPASSSTSQSSSNSQTMQKQPCISNVLNGSSVPKSFIPNVYPSMSYHEPICERMSAHHIPCNSKDISSSNFIPSKHSSRILHCNSVGNSPSKVHTSTQAYSKTDKSDRTNASVFSRNPSNDDKLPVKTSNIAISNAIDKQRDANEMICLSDSDEDVIIFSEKPLSHNNFTVTKSSVKEPVKVQSETKLLQNQSKKCENLPTVLDRMASSTYNHHSEMQIIQHNKPQNECKLENIVISNIQSIKPETVGGYLGCGDKELCKKPTDNGVDQHSDNKVVDIVEIFDEEQSDIEIISDGEIPTKLQPSTCIDDNKPHSSKGDVISSTPPHPSCSNPSLMPTDNNTHPRSKPHIAIVKPYSKENDENAVRENNAAETNVATVQAAEKSQRDDDVIELAEDDDGIVLIEGKPFDDFELSQEEKDTMKEIFQPLIVSSDNLSSSCVEKAISENFDFFSVLIGRGVPVNEIRRTVWNLFKVSGKESAQS